VGERSLTESVQSKFVGPAWGRRPPAQYVSLKQVAARAGVSFQTASKVLSGHPVRVAPETAERIHRVAGQLGYSPNNIARSLVRRSSMTIGVVTGSLRDPALAEFVVGAELAARQRGLSVLVANLTGDGAEGAQVVRSLIEQRVDGIIAAAPQLEEDTGVAELLRRYVPAISLHHIPGAGVPLVGSDHREVGFLAAEHLLAAGRRLLGTVAGPFCRRVVRSRRRGAEDLLREAGVEPREELVVEADWSPGGAAGATRLLLEREPAVEGVFVHSDLMAVGVLEAICSTGRAVPEDVAVVSCDDLPFAAYLRPALTTVRVPFWETGAKAVDLVLRRVKGEEVGPAPVLLPVELIVRQSSGLVASKKAPRRPGAGLNTARLDNQPARAEA
jgi:LacI family transcriptional regulator